MADGLMGRLAVNTAKMFIVYGGNKMIKTTFICDVCKHEQTTDGMLVPSFSTATSQPMLIAGAFFPEKWKVVCLHSPGIELEEEHSIVCSDTCAMLMRPATGEVN